MGAVDVKALKTLLRKIESYDTRAVSFDKKLGTVLNLPVLGLLKLLITHLFKVLSHIINTVKGCGRCVDEFH